MTKATIARWWANHWQVLNCKCSKPNGAHAFRTHTEAIAHTSEVYESQRTHWAFMRWLTELSGFHRATFMTTTEIPEWAARKVSK